MGPLSPTAKSNIREESEQRGSLSRRIEPQGRRRRSRIEMVNQHHELVPLVLGGSYPNGTSTFGPDDIFLLFESLSETGSSPRNYYDHASRLPRTDVALVSPAFPGHPTPRPSVPRQANPTVCMRSWCLHRRQTHLQTTERISGFARNNRAQFNPCVTIKAPEENEIMFADQTEGLVSSPSMTRCPPFLQGLVSFLPSLRYHNGGGGLVRIARVDIRRLPDIRRTIFCLEWSDYGSANLLRSFSHPTFDLSHSPSNINDSQLARAQLPGCH
ncbi:hypothetical protein G5I_02700 [Acromyrmex echinatior]|uniref:Uncharacterized protein n=1 Tax=Acromyrmex echinatior TaxID=103372 RepID=F4WB45_ACREC|nr:hypothetical protein G5I_02700 [Acromyrmex echinatior]